MSPSFLSKGFKTTYGECESSSCSGGLAKYRSQSVHDGMFARAVNVPLEDGFVADYIDTPVNSKACPSIGGSANILDDDLCESILEEIDALCEQKSAVKAEGRSPNSVVPVKSQFGSENGSEDGSNLSSFDGERFLLTASSLFLEAGLNSGAEQAAQTASLPHKYSKYLQSLNARQQEAACSDISVPLMIVAGPGSGKVLLSLSLPLLMALSNHLRIFFFNFFMLILLDMLLDFYNGRSHSYVAQ